ncbi:MAG: hypothetical protein IJM26_06680, partial [Lachnospiraceae bacterium]|nr:hypothetical protein [Lachnospiraceae bacterium]
LRTTNATLYRLSHSSNIVFVTNKCDYTGLQEKNQALLFIFYMAFARSSGGGCEAGSERRPFFTFGRRKDIIWLSINGR